MNKFVLAEFGRMESEMLIDKLIAEYDSGNETLVDLFGHERMQAHARIRTSVANRTSLPVYVNDVYQVVVDLNYSPNFSHLSIRRIDKEPIHDWRHLQQIKNVLIGPNYEGFEVYPCEADVVDTANQYHMFVYRDPGRHTECNLAIGRKAGVRTDNPPGGAKQRSGA